MKRFDDYNNEIRKNIIDLWAKDGYMVKNVETDPVVNLFITALSYQAYHIYNYIDQYEERTLRDLRDRTVPFHLLKPYPAFTIIETKLKDGSDEKIIDETCSFEFMSSSKKQKFAFAPLLNTKVINAELEVVNKIDNNVWTIALECTAPLDNLTGLSFYIDTPDFVTIESIKYRGDELPVIKPSQYNDLPFTKWFNNNHLLLKHNYYLFGTHDYWREVFLTHSNKLYIIDQYDPSAIHLDGRTIQLEITFNSAVDIYNILKINCIPIVNVEKKEIVLDIRNPIKEFSTDSGEFLNLLCMEGYEKDFDNILVRQHGVERFNSNKLFEQIQEMLNKYYSDYFAFQNIREFNTTDKWENLQYMMNEIRSIVSKSDDKKIKDHYYAILKKENIDVKKVDLNYLITQGTSVNGMFRDGKAVKTPLALDMAKTFLLMETKGGRDAIQNEAQKEDIAKYYFQTKDRLVTQADIIAFIKTYYYGEKRLGDEIMNLSIVPKEDIINIIISLKNDSYIRKMEKTDLVAEELQTKITLRSSGILPFKVYVS
ncbi:MAG: hypothetical protein FWF70_08160 [Bacteroidetes bacterium]|nr:hypothetical protein [Bacteroidota bacterium]MCL1968225.1 hypothetical protein [Bacteroidota bacterium]